ncbi:TPA: hypothetical protein ACH3X3_010655 [Trebouxia sp. C0006]
MSLLDRDALQPMECNAQNSDAAAVAGYSTLTGVCVTPKAAGAVCTVGYDVCSSGVAGQGVDCLNYQCPLLQADAVCYAGDLCSGYDGQGCNAVGTAAGTCVNTTSAGQPCEASYDLCSSGEPGGAPCPPSEYTDGNSDYQNCPALETGIDCTATDTCVFGATCVSGICTPFVKAGQTLPSTPESPLASPTDDDQPFSTAATVPAIFSTATLSAFTSVAAFNKTQQQLFVATVQGTIFTDLFAVVSVIITAVFPAGSVQVNNTIAFTAADYTAAVAGQAAVAAVLSTGDSSVFPDTSLGTVTFSAVTTGNATNPRAAIVSTSSPSGVTSSPASVISHATSNASVVPAVISTALLSNYATVNAFTTTERARFVATLESNILTAIEQLVNVTITKVVAGSISVSTSIAFTTADAAAALEGQSALAAVLQSNDVSSIFGDSFGDVTVTGVSKGNTTNPTVKSGAAPYGITLWAVSVSMLAAALAFNTM